ncbi:MAG: phosphatase PAP2 family protein [Methanobacterium sp.]
MLEPLITSSNTDIQIFYLINVYMQNTFFDFIMPILSEIGYFSFWILISIIIFFIGGEKGRKVALVCITALVAGYFISEILKIMVARPRPYEVLEGVRVLVTTSGYSWPSGHSVASFIAFTIYGMAVIGRRYGLFYFFLLVCLIMFSRIYIGVHYPSDVLSGALIGIFIGIIALVFENEILSMTVALKDEILKKLNF